MIKYIIKRLLISLVTIWAIATLCFFLLRLLPGNPFILQNPTQMTNAEKMMEYYGLNRPLWQQYLSYMNNLIHLDFGYSITHLGRSVNQVISQYFPITAQLGIQALLVGVPLGMLFGIISAVRRGSALDVGFQISTVIFAAIPGFVLAALLQLVFAVKLEMFPVSQWLSFRHTILPTIAIAIPIICGHTRAMRTLMLEVGKQDYLKTAKAKGVSKFRIIAFHQIRNAILPLITNLGLEIAGVLMGSYVVEKVFSIPGLGSYFVDSISGLDYTMTLGLVVFQSVLVVLANLIVDLLYGVVDPRVRVSYGITTWYSEGTAEYYSIMIPLRAGLITKETALYEIQRRTDDYYRNPTRHLENMESTRMAWKDRRAQKLPYGRGIFFLANCDVKMKEATGGKYGIDDVVLNILELQRQGVTLSNEVFLDEIKKLSGLDLTPDWEIMRTGTHFAPLAGSFGGHFTVCEVPAEEADTGEPCVSYKWEIKK